MATVMANGIGIYYERTGGDKPPIILLHGIRNNSHCWPRVVAALRSSYDLIMLNARGHGRSEAPEEGYDLAVLAGDVAGVIAALGLKQPAVVGHSLGALTAAELAGRYPDLVRCIVLEDPPWRYSEQTPEVWATLMDNFRAMDVTRKRMTGEQMAQHGLRTNPRMALWDKEDIASWVEGRQQVSLHVMDDMRSHPPHWREAVAQIVCPALLLTGDPTKGGFCPPETVREVPTLNPQIVVINMIAAGHNIRREAFSEYVEALRGFLDAYMC